ncbi:HdeD family acid-resistance protein [Aquabacterium sp. A7-Y]|uniref:HdeD family acid-resistance protein n=1 Tax=Aquabacterium sp. A7-Y TaxID=1349605 RepID=UPI00223D268B|nr:HdeD family acid-resistance protein [Aquabacterium sp. A7-Y]MCW7541752.1 HdeD family acid-resistance protein [Aquabacterium sp. A7-Y]
MKPDDLLPNPSWWVIALRGVAALSFGVLALVWPGITLLVLVSLFAAYALLAGAAATVGAIKRRGSKGWGLTLLLGIVSLTAGVVAIVFPGSTTLALVLLMGVNALITGALDIALAIRLRKVIQGEWLMALSGVLSIVFGAIVIAVPVAGAVALVWIVSFYAMLTGVLLLALAMRTRRWAQRHAAPVAA